MLKSTEKHYQIYRGGGKSYKEKRKQNENGAFSLAK